MSSPLQRAAAESHALAPAPMFLFASPEVCVARVGFGLLVHLDDTFVWSRSGAEELFREFVRVAGSRVRWFRTSTRHGWQWIAQRSTLDEIARDLSVDRLDARIRHLFEVAVADDYGAPGVHFLYREVDERRAGRGGYLEIVLPLEDDPAQLRHWVTSIGQKYPVRHALAGYVATWNRELPGISFDPILAWTKRYSGLHAHHLDTFFAATRTGLPGVAWLNLIGKRFAEEARIRLDALASRRWSTDVRATLLEHGLLIQAGEAPELGDRNLMRYPWAIAELAQRLDAHFADAELPGAWEQDKLTAGWLHRFSRAED